MADEQADTAVSAEPPGPVTLFYRSEGQREHGEYEVAPEVAAALPPVLPVHVLIAKVKAEVGAIAKNRRSESGGNYNFRGIDDVYDALHDPLAKWGLLTIPTVLDREYVVNEWMESNRRRAQTLVRIQLAVDFYGPLGDSVRATAWSEAQDYGDKATAKAMSVAFRTIMFQVFSIPVHDDAVGRDNETENDPREPAANGGGDSRVAPAVVKSVGNRLRQVGADWSVEQRQAFVAFAIGRDDIESLNDLSLDEANLVLERASSYSRGELKLVFRRTDGGYLAEVPGEGGDEPSGAADDDLGTGEPNPPIPNEDEPPAAPTEAPGPSGEPAESDAPADADGSDEPDGRPDDPIPPQEVGPEVNQNPDPASEAARRARAEAASADIAAQREAASAQVDAGKRFAELAAQVEAMEKPELVTKLREAELATTGTLAKLKDRLLDHLIEKEGIDA